MKIIFVALNEFIGRNKATVFTKFYNREFKFWFETRKLEK